ncbi:BspA family leucine-rich repeat surface protein, partial [Myroides marinus]|uniref:BspA family leucine-rich repeat surface protein n=1 Tax=Myroides marinus TaxID=703342 RepID=UPI002574F15A
MKKLLPLLFFLISHLLSAQTSKDAFITIWEVPEGGSIKIYVSNQYQYDYNVSLEKIGNPSPIDSKSNHKITYTSPDLSAGQYKVTITGVFPHFNASGEKYDIDNANKLLSVDQWGTQLWVSMHRSFAYASNLISVGNDSPNLTSVEDISYMFLLARKVNSDLSKWKVSSVKNMEAMFHGASSFTSDLNKWDVANVTNMVQMFSGAGSFNGDLNNWDVSNVTDMSYMFASASLFNGNVSNWNVSKVTKMIGMFSGASSFNKDLNKWIVSNVTNMVQMFSGAGSFNGDLNKWNVSKVEDMSDMFWGAGSFNRDLSQWNVSKVTDMSRMFWGAGSFNGDLNKWNVSKVTDMSEMLDKSGMSVDNYDVTLKGWANLATLPKGITFGVLGLKYCTASDERDKLIKEKGWKIKGDIKLGSDYILNNKTVVYNKQPHDIKLNTTPIAPLAVKYEIYDSSNNEVPEAINVGEYTVKVIISGCGADEVKKATLSITSVLKATTSKTDVSCNGGSDGTASVSVLGGKTPYRYVWSTGAETQSITGLAEGTYTVTVIDADNYFKTEIITVKQPIALTATTSITDVNNQGGTNGAATVTPSGGTAPYRYVWSTGATTQSITGLAAGIYTVTITDANNCSILQSVIITEPKLLSPHNNILYVKEGATSTGDGSSWANAVPDLADALKWADANKSKYTSTAPLQIWVAKGTYTPKYRLNTVTLSGEMLTDRDNTFLMVDNVELYGGFAGIETDVKQRNFTTNETILSGDIGTVDNIGDNVYHVVMAANTTGVDTKIDGFTITKGNANGSTFVTINGQSVVQNSGGGILSSSSVILTNSEVNNNTASSGNGGGIFSSSSVILTNSKVNNNTASSGNGGGIFSSSSSVILTNSEVNNNTASNGGGIFSSSSSSSVILTNSEVNNNTASSGNGGGIFSSSSSSSFSSSSVILTNSKVNNNTASNGGGIHSYSYSYSYSFSSSSVILTNSEVNNNTASNGGGIHSYSYSYSSSSSSVSLLNSNIIGNKGNDAIYYDNETNNKLTVHNSIIYGNKDQNNTVFAGDSWLGGSKPTGANLVYKHSLVQGSLSTSDGNLDGTAYPLNDLFTDVTNKDYSLKSNSPLIDKGANSLYTGENLDLSKDRDIVGNPRLVGVIDIGAYESLCNLQATISKTDVNCYGESNGSATVSVSGGTSPYTYSWAPSGGTAATATGLAAGTYTVTITDANACTTTATATITEPNVVQAPKVTSNSVSFKYGDSATALVATNDANHTLKWYEGDNKTLLTKVPIPITNKIGKQTYWVSQVNSTECESELVKIEVTITPATLTVTAEAKTKVYGGVDPALT